VNTFETTVVVGDDRKLTLQLPAHIAPGAHRIVLLIEDNGAPAQPLRIEDWPIHDAGLADPNFTMRREHIYGDDGR
jgi:hypothetical protein